MRVRYDEDTPTNEFCRFWIEDGCLVAEYDMAIVIVPGKMVRGHPMSAING